MASFKLWASLFCVALLALGQLPGSVADPNVVTVADPTKETIETNVKNANELEVASREEEVGSDEETSEDVQDRRRLGEETESSLTDEATENGAFRGNSVNELVNALTDALDGVDKSTKKEEALDPMNLTVLITKMKKILLTLLVPKVKKLPKLKMH
eukprot:GHVS01080940.1.p1 GENE.GHVS01080940.1~~GHVS01080940.1.p1  ORF type:complete len:157 (+),score=29.76 GHVS01080940.1:183-653(+)